MSESHSWPWEEANEGSLPFQPNPRSSWVKDGHWPTHMRGSLWHANSVILLCGLKHLTSWLWASVSLPVKWGCSALSYLWARNRRESTRCALSALLNIGRLSAYPPAPAARHQRSVITTGLYCFPGGMFVSKGKACNLLPKSPNQTASEMLVTENPPETKCPCEVISERQGTWL